MVRRVCSCDAHSDIAQRVRPKSDVRRVRKRHVEAIVSPQADETPVCCFFFFYLYIYCRILFVHVQLPIFTGNPLRGHRTFNVLIIGHRVDFDNGPFVNVNFVLSQSKLSRALYRH